jgi:hypothetical protein
MYAIYRALGFNSISYIEMLAIQVCAQITMEASPIPGGAGLSEGIFHSLFIVIFASKLADVGMLLTRTFTFYIPMLVSAIIILGDYIFRKTKS